MPGKLVSPNDMQAAACKIMLDGRQPVTYEDWQRCANFWAANISSGMEVSASILLGLILQSPLSNDEIEEIAIFQQGIKAGKKATRKRSKK